MIRKEKTGGFSLTEVLVATLLLAVGVLGAAGVHLTTMRLSRQAAYQALALDLAAEIADAIRTGTGRLADASDFWEIDSRPSTDEEAGASSCYADPCDAAEYAAFELREWKRRVAALFPDGRLLICRDALVWNTGKGTLNWDCSAAGGAPLAIKLGWLAGGKGADAPAVALTVNPPAR